jgi:histidinol phosphatase-like enzyme (inositol monophosphatase family)
MLMRATNQSRPSDKALIDFAHLLADQAAKATLPHFRKVIQVQDKGSAEDFDPVTVADKNAERVMSKLIGKHFPSHGLIGEEFGTRNEGARLRWVLDPIDGTRAFIMGQPLWGTLIGLIDGRAPAIGLMAQPFTQERFWGSSAGAFWRRADGPAKRIKTRSGLKIGEAILASTAPNMLKGHELAFDRVSAAARMTRFGGDCYNYCLLASGFVDIVIEAGLKTYDVVALIPIIEQAGGVITTWDGKPATDGGSIVASGDPRVHEQVLKLLAKG